MEGNKKQTGSKSGAGAGVASDTGTESGSSTELGSRPASVSCPGRRSGTRPQARTGHASGTVPESCAGPDSVTAPGSRTGSDAGASTGSGTGAGVSVEPPRRRKPQKQVSQLRHSQDHPLKVIVTGFPPYSQPQDLTRTFGRFGAVSVEALNARFAALSFEGEEQAAAALKASRRLHVYGEFLHVQPWSKQRVTQLQTRAKPSNQPGLFPRSKQKEQIIEPKDMDFSGTFEEQLDRLLARVRLTQEQVTFITSLYADVEHALQAVWPGCVAIPFGSIPAGLGVQWSDADCFVMLPPEAHPADHVRRAKRRLEDFRQVFTEIIAIPQANTPIVKFFHAPTGTNCDLSFKTPLGARNTQLVAALLQSDARLLPAALLLKYWARGHALTGTGRLSSYALTLLLLAYLQVRGVVPSVLELQAGRAAALVDHWDAGFRPPRRAALDPCLAPLDLLAGFFRYYAAFDFDALAVCPYLGRPLPKELFQRADRLPPEFRRYRENVAEGRAMPLRHGTPFVVQDPFEQSVNVASAVGARFAAEIRSLVEFAADAYAQGVADDHRRFLPTILLRRPPEPRRDRGAPEFRVNVFPRAQPVALDADWKPLVRGVVLTIFEKMLRIELGKVEEKLDPLSKREREKYAGVLTKTIWRRRPHAAAALAELDFQERQARITEDILRTDERTWDIRFQLILTYRRGPDGAVVAIKMAAGDKVGFREFGKFFVSMMQGWFSILMKLRSRPGNDDDDDDDDDGDDPDARPVVSMVVQNSTLNSERED